MDILLGIALGMALGAIWYYRALWLDAEQRVEWLERALTSKLPRVQVQPFDLKEMFGEDEE